MLPQDSTQQQTEPVTYVCSDCGFEVSLQLTANVRCRQCGSRILNKKRLRTKAEYSAR